MKEQRQFQGSPHMLFQTIYNQAGSNEMRIIESKDLTKKERLSLESIGVIEKHARFSVIRELGSSKLATRKIVVGSTSKKNVHAWTDGCSYIAIEQDFLNDCMNKGYYGMIQLFHVLVHEYLHDTNHSKNHVHSFEFYEAFHNVMLRSDYMTSIQADIKKSAIAYGEKLVRNGFSLSRSYKQQENLLNEEVNNE